jgi:phosphate uptake regulator
MKVDPANVDQLVEMLLICKYAERIADHAQTCGMGCFLHPGPLEA